VKHIQIIGDTDNQRSDKWSFTVRISTQVVQAYIYFTNEELNRVKEDRNILKIKKNVIEGKIEGRI
jgi:hypothetical protein